MTAGTLVPVVGPSGAGKDTLMEAVRLARPDIHIVRRAITRAPDAGGEPYRPVTPEGFEAERAAGRYLFHWGAHGLLYGIPAEVLDLLAAGRHVMFNGSRGILDAARAAHRPCRIIVVTAPAAVLAKRLAGRGRESADEIARRLARAGYAAPSGPDVTVVDNGGRLEDAARAMIAALPPVPAAALTSAEKDPLHDPL